MWWLKLILFDSAYERVCTTHHPAAGRGVLLPMPVPRDILYVDDERSNLIVFEAAFEDDFRVHTVDNAAEALQLIDQLPIPVVIADQRMPGMTGVEMLTRLRRNHPHIQRVILSGYSESEAIIDSINQGQIFQFIRKPWQRSELMTVIRRAMDAHDMALSNTSLMDRLLVAEQCAMIGQAAAEIAHEMGNQLNMLPLVEVIEDEYSNDTQLLTLARMARSSHERLSTLVNEIKSIIRQEGAEVQLQLVSMSDVIRELLSFLRFSGLDSTTQIVADLRCDPVILGNKLKLHQILLNLIKNATDATSECLEGRITLHLREQAGDVLCTIADNGTGIPLEIREKIWEPFFTTKAKSGNGFGLDLVKRLVEAQHGQIHMETEMGRGTQFTLKFPMVAAPDPRISQSTFESMDTHLNS